MRTNQEIIEMVELIGKKLIDYYFERMLGTPRKEEKGMIDIGSPMDGTIFVETTTKPYTKIPEGTPKIDPNRIFNFKNSKGELQICQDYMDYPGCGNLLSWDLRPGRNTPLHVNQDGKILGNGNCPNR